jgi:hypothetical protein
VQAKSTRQAKIVSGCSALIRASLASNVSQIAAKSVSKQAGYVAMFGLRQTTL